ncbi:MAG TPA: LuxR C-terminal-related transcriptional regulator, partial [Solirubrobacterales bacterium]|nr:LuxR C-terminal-related transcriptional regulator [Solirubrobacterales bacterium]
RTQADALIAVLERGLRASDTAVIALGPDAAIAAASGVAFELLQAYFPDAGAGTLPPRIAEWLAGAPAYGPGPLVVEGPRGRLTVREAAAERAGSLLVLEEERAPSAEALRALGLTRRQSEVLHLLARGRSTDEIAADLFVSRQTVRKHLEHIYHRLGVNTREAAVAMAREGPGLSR